MIMNDEITPACTRVEYCSAHGSKHAHMRTHMHEHMHALMCDVMLTQVSLWSGMSVHAWGNAHMQAWNSAHDMCQHWWSNIYMQTCYTSPCVHALFCPCMDACATSRMHAPTSPSRRNAMFFTHVKSNRALYDMVACMWEDCTTYMCVCGASYLSLCMLPCTSMSIVIIQQVTHV